MGNIKLNLSANNGNELIQQLSRLDISVPKITEGRTTIHRERFVMAHLLASYAMENLFGYPVIVEHVDNPDFVILYNGHKVGIECVECVPRDAYEVAALRERNRINYIGPEYNYANNAKALSKEDKIKISQGCIYGIPRMGDDPEISWSEKIHDSIMHKLYKLRGGSYGGVDEIWLLIQEECREPVCADDLDKAVDFLLPKLKSVFDGVYFEKIFIHTCGHFIQIEKGSVRKIKTYRLNRNGWL